MYLTFALVISVVGLVLSGYAVSRSPLVGPQGPAGKDGAPGPIVQAIVDSAHVECLSCHRVVARYTSTDAGMICVNCAH